MDLSRLGFGKGGKKGDFVSTLTRMVSVLPEGKPLWGGPCRKVGFGEVDVRPSGGKESKNDPEDPATWEVEISKAGASGAFDFFDRILLEGGNVGGGEFILWSHFLCGPFSVMHQV